MKEEVTANTCVNCGALQGNWFVMEYLIGMEVEGQKMDELVDMTLSNDLKFEDLLIEREELASYTILRNNYVAKCH